MYFTGSPQFYHVQGLFLSVPGRIIFLKVYDLTLKISKHCTNVQNEYYLNLLWF